MMNTIHFDSGIMTGSDEETIKQKPSKNLKQYKLIRKTINKQYLEIVDDRRNVDFGSIENLIETSRSEIDMDDLFLAEVDGTIYRATTMSAGECLLVDVKEYISFSLITKIFKCPEKISNIQKEVLQVRNLSYKKMTNSERLLREDLLEYTNNSVLLDQQEVEDRMVRNIFLNNEIFRIKEFNPELQTDKYGFDLDKINFIDITILAKNILKSTKFSSKTGGFGIWNLRGANYEKGDFEEFFGENGIIATDLVFSEEQCYDRTKVVRNARTDLFAFYITNVSTAKSNSKHLFITAQDLKKMQIYYHIKETLNKAALEKPKFYGTFSDLQIGDYIVFKDIIKKENKPDFFRAKVEDVKYNKSTNDKTDSDGGVVTGIKSIQIRCFDLDFKSLWVDPKDIYWMPKELETYPPVALKIRISRRQLDLQLNKLKMLKEHQKILKIKSKQEIAVCLKQKSNLAKNLYYADFVNFI